MKETYLVFENGAGSALRVASKEEWNKILRENRNLPREERRFFIRDCFEDGDIMDSMFIETTKHEYDKWHAEHQKEYLKRLSRGEAVVFSIDIPTQTSEGLPLVDVIPDDTCWEERMIGEIRILELREALSVWRDWANELLDYYLSGMQREATAILSEQHGVSAKTIRKRKRAFEAFCKNFLK